MFIIFDLDDTLIDTSGSVTPFKLKQCAKIFGVSEDALIRENRRQAKAKDAILSFAEKYGLESKVEEALLELSTPLPDGFIVSQTPDANEVLFQLSKKYKIALVTLGNSLFQEEKLKKSGIDRSLFSMIKVLERPEKKLAYVEMQERFFLKPKDIWVCGDRIELDLRPAYELGYHTIHMKWGRGLEEKHEDWIDHSIQGLKELKERIK